MKLGVYLTQVTSVPGACFLTFVKPVSIYDASVVEWYAGAIFISLTRRWMKIGAPFVAANKASLTHDLLWDFEAADAPRKAYLDMFAEAISTGLNGFTHETRAAYFKGRSFGAAIENGPGLAMKSLKVGFNALGVVHDAYGGLRTSEFTADDVKAYAKRMIRAGASKLSGDVHGGFEEIRPVATSSASFTAGRLAAPRGSDESPVYGGAITSNVLSKYTPSTGELSNPEDTTFRSPLKDPTTGYVYTSEYGFRADSRCPADICSLGGMQPNAIRDDKQELRYGPRPVDPGPDATSFARDIFAASLKRWNQRGGKEVLDNYTHQATWGSDYSGYVSVSRSLKVAYRFYLIQKASAQPCATAGWIYAARARDAVDVGATFTKPRYNEREISVAGGIGWKDIVGWRKINNGVMDDTWAPVLFITTNQTLLPASKRAELVRVLSAPLAMVKGSSV